MEHNDLPQSREDQQQTMSANSMPGTDTDSDESSLRRDAPGAPDTEPLPDQASQQPTNLTSGETAASDSSHNAPVIAVRNLTKTYRLGRHVEVNALQSVSLQVAAGEFVAVMGPSGSGKSTFMNLIGCLDHPTSGEYWLNGKPVSHLSSNELAAIRNRMIGFVFQGFNLLGRASALKNVALPMIYAGLPKYEREQRAFKTLQLVGLGKYIQHKPSELSGGQQQRVAIARALVNGPSLLLADEPTGNLDSRTSMEFMAVLQALNERGLTIVLVTHDSNIANYAKRIVAFLDGHIVQDEVLSTSRSARTEWEALIKESTIEGQG